MKKIETKKVIVDEKTTKRGVDALRSFKAIMTVVDKHRPYEPSDFVKEYYIPNI